MGDEMQSYFNQRQILKGIVLPSVSLRGVESLHAPDNWGDRHRKCRTTFLLTIGIFVTLVGCAGPMNDTGGKHIHEEWVAEFRRGSMPTKGIKDTNATADDSFIFRMKAVKDYEFGNYVRNLRRATSWGEFASDSVKIILDSLVAVTGGEATKSALGLASAGVTGATTSIKKNVLFDQSITTFITKMDTLRLNKWNDILCKLNRCSPDVPKREQPYTIAEAFNDLEDYGRCGTLDAALRDVDAKTSAEQKTVQHINDKINKVENLKNSE
jgi:hypothetical protein